MRIDFHSGARDDYESSFEWYLRQNHSAGCGFVEAIDSMLDVIAQYPSGFAIVRKNCRGATVDRYPYQIIYLADSERILVIAFAHAKRRPGYWLPRLKEL